MAITGKVDPIEKDIDLLIKQDLSPEAQSRQLADFAIETLEATQEKNAEALGHVPHHNTFVDGQEGAPEASVKPDGTIVYEFELALEAFAWIASQLESHSPVGAGRDKHPGLYKRSHIFYADGVESDAFNPPPGTETAAFVNAVPYARRIEHGLSPHHPDGVYEVVAALAQRRFGNLLKITFTYSAIIQGHSVTQSKAASTGKSWWLGHSGIARSATGAFEKTLSATEHNKSNVRYPAIQITVR